ncbi:hypothetical protein I302_106480 [Kwoniella bestiolae CBS 10118]|uniref:Uncharacterized protein n=1 Tax=Kwoniella bestiolae CBS 10118 TaxID=1296100 RepID=A0A1B9G1A0_9TREE|nr:hypothetical protein I302_06263 [Kwoniella bestiolae CBS 10118]OCF24802.1 hypothetical protein I302_06263 [Kwoniella bestiolae CBS 10118]
MAQPPPRPWNIAPFPYPIPTQPGMTFHPPPHPGAGVPWVNHYPPRPALQAYDSTSTVDTSMHSIEEGEEEMEDLDPTYTGRPERKKKVPNQYDPSSRKAPPKSKGKGKATSQSRSKSNSVLNKPTLPTAPSTEEDLGSSTAIFLPDPYQPPIQLKGLSKNGLLPAPQGCILDVNDLLILHPPEKHTEGLQGHTSQYEMYTCRVCSKTYDGKNARSVARRHLQDKHGVPLSVQKRRSRWDYEPDRPKSQQDAKERSLKSKRDWINKHRQIQKLEQTHEAFLERFGPSGIITPCGMRLVAPKYRGEEEARNVKNKRFLDGTQGNLIIPEGILRGVEAIKEYKSVPRYSGELLGPSPEEEPDVSVDMNEGKVIVKQGKGKKKSTTVSDRSSISASTSQSEIMTKSTTPLHPLPSNAPSPSQQYYNPSVNTSTPISASRGILANPPQIHPWHNQPLQPASMTFINGQYHFTFQPQYQQYPQPIVQPEHEVIDAQVMKVAPMDEDSLPSSPEEMPPIPDQQWVPSESWSSIQAEPQQLEPALDITQQWQSLQLSSWPGNEEADQPPTKEGRDGSVEAEGEAVAAETLLNLHSTPLRGPEENERNDIQLARDQAIILPPEVLNETANKEDREALAWSSSLLSAPAILSPTRTRPARSSSIIQPFRDPRPEITRSLSFDARPNLDDPFVLPDTPTRPSSANGSNKPTPFSSMRWKKRHTISMPSPSPLSSGFKKRKEAPTPTSPRHGMTHTQSGRSALKPISTNIKPNYSGAFATPIKPSASGFPQSVTKEWLQFSSPNGPDAAMSLGLAPTHFAPATPGLRGIIGAETPEMTILEARAKKRRSEGTPGVGFGFGRR